MVEYITVLMVLLTLGFLGTKLADYLHIPHSVFLVVMGIAAGFILRMQEGVPLQEIQLLFPEIIMYVLLPPLIFESAYNFDSHELKRDIVPITALAVVSLLLSTILVGLGMHYLLGLPLIPSLVFGALISATDPVAVVALFKEIGAPKRLNSLVEGESLLNDGTAIVMFRVMLGFAAVPLFNAEAVASGVVQFIQVAAGGVVVGAVFAGLMSLALRMTSAMAAAQLGLTVAAAYLSFLVADHVFHVSGVIATMTVGLFLGTRARLELNKEALHGMHHVWEFMSLTANIIVFFGVGLTVDPGIVGQSLAYVPVTVLLIYAIRAISVWAVVPVINWTKVARPISGAYQAILIWGGLRGGLALALVLTLPEDFPFKQLFLALSASVVLATLLVNALTIKPVMHWLKVDRLNPVDEDFYVKTLDLLGTSVFDSLTQAAKTGSISSNLVAEKKTSFEAQFTRSQTGQSNQAEVDLMFGLNSLLLNEKRHYDEALENAILSRSAYSRLCRTVAERQAIFDQDGWDPLKTYRFASQVRRSWFGPSVRHLVLSLEIPLHQLFAILEAGEKSTHPEVKALADLWVDSVREQLAEFYTHYPNLGIAVQSAYIANTVRATALKTVEELLDSAIISGAVSAQARKSIHSSYNAAALEARRLFHPSLDYLLGRVPLFKTMPPFVLTAIAAKTKEMIVKKGTAVVREGDVGRSLFLVTAGFLEVGWTALPAGQTKPKLFVGDYFGEISLVFDQPRTATVTAVIDSVLIEIDQATFQELLRDFPEVRDDIRKTAEGRLHV